MSSSLTIWAHIRAKRCARPSERPAHLIFLPKYSPDLNPIEQLFAKLKTLLRKKAARTVDAICDAIGELLNSFSPQECANYLKTPNMRQDKNRML